MPTTPKPSFVSRNLVAIVMVPSLIAVHFGWNLLQDNRKLVAAEEQIDLPPVTFAKYAWKRLTGNNSGAAAEKSDSD
ncbi:PREDICTED: uncharacterized protein LOC108615531 [Drosophila arizonae]|uniref:Uncharacterized protein LOC108615531 n=1 Tax=Drosophila arizonae TaxID=7263 RepID=A0ABM1PED6_DROAR|nr:PREDICTED: uncharacterized protein LOC108615531 [Drosophila arizonae]